MHVAESGWQRPWPARAEAAAAWKPHAAAMQAARSRPMVVSCWRRASIGSGYHRLSASMPACPCTHHQCRLRTTHASRCRSRSCMNLHRSTRERKRRETDPALGQRCAALKHYQQARFRNTYRRPAAASSLRDRIAVLPRRALWSARLHHARRAVRAHRAGLAGAVSRVHRAGRRHAREPACLVRATGHGDGRNLPSTSIAAGDYVRAWQVTGRRQDRERQVELTVEVGMTLDALHPQANDGNHIAHDARAGRQRSACPSCSASSERASTPSRP